MNSEIKTIETKKTVSSLCWNGDDLIDFADGGNIYQLDGTALRSRYFNAFKFDAAVISPSRRFGVAYEKLGTKGVIFHENKVIREINRSFYFAGTYEYPVVLFQLPDGREVIAHCPDKYNKLEIEELETGKRLTQRDNKPQDFFHSRLTVSPDSKHLMSAGWIWQPIDWIAVYEVEQVLREPSLLDTDFVPFGFASGDINSACFLNSEEFVCWSTDDAEDFDEDEPEENRHLLLRPGNIGVFDLQAKSWRSVVLTTAEIGTMFALDEKHVLSVYDHPKVVDVATGEVVQQWPELKTSKQSSSIIRHIDPIPPMAFDKTNRRFAVAEDKTIRVITIPHYD